MNLTSHQKSRTFRGWAVKGKPAYISSNYQDLSFTAIVTFSKQHFYGVMVNENINDSDLYRHFLINLIEARRNNFWSK